MQELAVALVDYDNVKIREDRNAGDVGINLADVVPTIVSEASRHFARPKELLIRMYGGWIDENGQHSPRAQWLLVGLAWYRGRSGQTIVKPTLATSLACRASDTLIGTIRRTATGFRQKMVDNTLAFDALYFARDHGIPVIVFSDDDDLVPAALATSSMTDSFRFHWLRRRKVGSGLNDAILRRAGITIGSTSSGAA